MGRSVGWSFAACLAGSVIALGVLLAGGGWGSAYAEEVTAEPLAPSASEAEAARHFDAVIAPLLARHCLECHDSTVQENRLDLSRRETAEAGGRTGPAIVPGNLDESLAWEYVFFEDMPPDDRTPLTDEEKELFRAWIDAGAVWSGDRIDLAAVGRDSRALEQWLQRLTRPEYIETVRSAVGVDIESEARELLPPDRRTDGFSNTAYNLSVDLAHVEAYADLAAIIVERMDVEDFAAEFVDCQTLDETCMRELIAEMGHWLLRGPLQEHEIDAFAKVADAVAEAGGDYEEATRYVIEAMLQSPRFVYRIEVQRGDGSPRPVSAYELASRMSYIILGGPPDRELMRAADAGELSDDEAVRAQVERMLDDPRAVARSQQFIHEWMGLERLEALQPNAERFPEWSPELARDMEAETLAYFTDVIWRQQRPVWDVLNAQVTFATPRLAEFYELHDAEATPTGTAPAANPGRVADGLQVLYTFEDSGSLVRDMSDTGEPIDLHVRDTNAAAWRDTGLRTDGTIVSSDVSTRPLNQAISESGEVTVEAWVTPANESQDGPARIVTLSASTSTRNLTLGQDGDQFSIRLRTTETSDNGIPAVATPSGTVQADTPVHVVYTRSADGEVAVYLDGRRVVSEQVGGDLLNWNPQFALALGAELSGDRPWRGDYHLVALYDRALPADQVLQNHAAGAHGRNRTVVEAAYRFDAGEGDVLRDSSGADQAIDLQIADADAVRWRQGGLVIEGETRIASAEPPRQLMAAIRESHAITLEAWVTPANTTQDGPARILSLSSGTGERNFTLGQDGDRFDVRLRTTATDANGMPGLASPGGSLEARPTHVAYTRDPSGRAAIYINGELAAEGDVSGDLSNWDESYRLLIANESTGDRPWRGTVHGINIYSRALTSDEIAERGGQMWRYDVQDLNSRGGLLTHAGVLTVGGDEASMVARGLFVLHDILDSAVGSAPPGVDTTPVPPEPGLSQRGLAEDRLSNQACVGCHSRFEPLAFGLEKFNGIGQFQEVDEHGNELREDGEMLIPGREEPVPYETVTELMEILAGSDRVHRTVTRKLTQFAIGRPLVGADERIVDQIHATAKQNGGTYRSLVTAIVMSDLVQKTRTEPNP